MEALKLKRKSGNNYIAALLQLITLLVLSIALCFPELPDLFLD